MGYTFSPLLDWTTMEKSNSERPGGGGKRYLGEEWLTENT